MAKRPKRMAAPQDTCETAADGNMGVGTSGSGSVGSEKGKRTESVKEEGKRNSNIIPGIQ